MTKLKALLAKKDSNKGFTLMEMIIVIAIIAILIALIAPNLISYLNTANETKVKANAKVCYTSANAWVAQQKVKGQSVKDGSITVTAGKTTETSIKDTANKNSDAAKALFNSLDVSSWNTGEKLVLEFKGGVCIKATFTSDNLDGEYPSN